jgi:hypothetical protein
MTNRSKTPRDVKIVPFCNFLERCEAFVAVSSFNSRSY